MQEEKPASFAGGPLSSGKIQQRFHPSSLPIVGLKAIFIEIERRYDILGVVNPDKAGGILVITGFAHTLGYLERSRLGLLRSIEIQAARVLDVSSDGYGEIRAKTSS